MYKLLIVEDEAHEREGLVGFLDWQSMGIEIVGAASDGEEGLSMARAQLPDIVISDVRMPHIDGIEMISRMRVFLPEVEVIVSSGHDEFELARGAIRVGVSEYLLKPVERRPLEEAIATCRRKIETRRRAAAPSIDFDPHTGKQLRHFEQTLARLLLAIKSLDPEKIAQTQSAVRESLAAGARPQGRDLSAALSRWVVDLGRELADLGLKADLSVGTAADLTTEIASFENAPEHETGPVEGFVARIAVAAQSAIRDRSGDRKSETVREVMTLIERSYGKAIGLNTISDAIGVSPNYLGKIFAEVTGTPFNEYLSRFRLDKAKTLLDEGALKIQAVAEAVGYPNVPYFCTLFKNTFGLSPTQYQKKLD